VLQRGTRDVFEDRIAEPVVALSRVEELYDVRVRQIRVERRLAPETLDVPVVRTVVGPEDLERDQLAGRPPTRLKDAPEAPATDLRQHVVRIREHGPDRWQRGVHGDGGRES